MYGTAQHLHQNGAARQTGRIVSFFYVFVLALIVILTIGLLLFL